MFIPYYDNNYFYCMPFIPANCDKPPTVYSILNSIVNGSKEDEDYTKIRNLAKEGRSKIFDFYYPLSENVSKETFECMILNHYLKRRIGYDTVTNFKIMLEVKLNEIMPFYNKMFDAIKGWEIFNDGESVKRYGFDNTETEINSETNTKLENESKTKNSSNQNRKRSDLPQSQLEDIGNDSYITEQNLDLIENNGSDNSTSNGNTKNVNNGFNNKEYEETIEKTEGNKIQILKELQENIQSIYALIFKDLDCLFYGIL